MTRKVLIAVVLAALLVAGGVAVGVAVSHGFDHARQIGAVAGPWHGYRGYDGGGFGYSERFFPGMFLFLVLAVGAVVALIVVALENRRWACLGGATGAGGVASAADPDTGDHPDAGER